MRLLTLFLFSGGIYAAQQGDVAERCKEQLKEDKRVIQSLKDLHQKQLEAINESLEKEDAELYWDGKQYYIIYKAEIPVYDLDENGKPILVAPAKVTKKIKYEFKDDQINDRPHGLIGNVFKLGGGMFFNRQTQAVYPDAMLMYELFSFDKWFGFYGLSLNVSAGLTHVGGSLGYQFVHSRWFRNTSFIIGYGYNFMEGATAPFAGIALNF